MEVRYHQSKPNGRPQQLCALWVEDGPTAHCGLSLCPPNRPPGRQEMGKGQPGIPAGYEALQGEGMAGYQGAGAPRLHGLCGCRV